jgi:tRNA1(Val) A37 N6-methylase TrmN6
MDLTKLSKTELLLKCQELGIRKCKTKNKKEIIELIKENTLPPKPKENTLPPKPKEITIPPNINYSNLSVNLTKNIHSIEKKNNGIYFTPPNTIIQNLNRLKPFMKNIKTVLEPSCGSCEYILMLDTNYTLDITGIEIHKGIFESIKSFEKSNIKLYNNDYLNSTSSSNEKYDLIIGNPPYFVMNKNEVDHTYYDYFEGRPNIFILFIIKSLRLLNENGLLSFVLPKSFLNCLYYEKTRKYIIDQFKIIDIIECNDKYLETTQETIIMIIQNTIGGIHNEQFCLHLWKFKMRQNIFI